MSRIPRRTSRAAVVLLAGALTLAGCSGDSESSDAQSTPAPDDTTEAAPAPKRWPFTGETTGRLPQRRAMVVKIENTESSEPQRGLGAADLVVEQLVEGGLTRLAAFYYSSLPADVGPVRSIRGTDIGIVKPANAVLVASGGAPKTMRRVRQAGIPVAGEGSPGFHRVSDRPAPYNLFANLRTLARERGNGPKPRSYLPWGPARALGAGKPAKQVTAQFSGGSATQWTWNGRAWQQADSHAAQGEGFRPDNLLALQVRQVDAGYRDPAGNPVPESVLAGKGPATLFHRGLAYQGAWMKRSPAAPLRLVTAKGKKLSVPPGHTWIELIPRSGGGGLRFGR
jgi:hypothetical protein